MPPETNQPSLQPNDYGEFYAGFIDSADSGYKQVRITDGVDIGKKLLDMGYTKKQLRAWERKYGIQLQGNVGYGSDDRQRGRLLEILNTIKESKGTGREKNKFGGLDLETQLTKLTQDATRFGVANYSYETQKLKGFAGLSSLDKAQAIRAWEQKNPDKNFASLSTEQQARVFGLKPGQYTDKDRMAANDFASSDRFQQYSTAQEIFQTGLQAQLESQKNYLAAQKKVQEPGYAQNTIDQSFAPAETQLRQFYEAAPGQKISEAAKTVGDMESSLGRTGSERVAANLAIERGRAQERLSAQKQAAVGQLQQYIDLKQPTEALRYGGVAGQSALNNLDYFRNQLLAPYQQVFPMAAKQYQLSLMPFSMQQQVPGQPGAADYILGGVGAAGDLYKAFSG